MKYAYVRPTTKIASVKSTVGSTSQDMFAVVDNDRRYKGYIRASDIVNITGDDLNLTVNEVLSKLDEKENRNIFVYHDADVAQAKRLINSKNLPFVPVIDYDGYYMGTVDQSST